ncbi:MAG: hypothetical protein ACT4O0_05280 [Pseudonocardia sp.]
MKRSTTVAVETILWKLNTPTGSVEVGVDGRRKNWSGLAGTAMKSRGSAMLIQRRCEGRVDR